MTAAELADLDFGQLIKQTRAGCLIKPRLIAYIEATKELEVPGLHRRDLVDREPDGWFHPSTHPGWSERALYEYLAHPTQVVKRRLDFSGKLSVTAGTALHGMFQQVLRRTGDLPPEHQVCRTGCPPEARCQEPSWADEDTGARGHADGDNGEDLVELKFTNENTWAGTKRLMELEDREDEAFARFWPDYWDQAIEYQRLSGRRRTIVLLGMQGFPWEFREFHVVYDRARANEVRDKYRRVRQQVADQRPGRCLCAAKERAGCAARRLCR